MPADLKPQFRVFRRPGLTLHRARQGPFLNNSWLIVDPATQRCALVDPFYDAGEVNDDPKSSPASVINATVTGSGPTPPPTASSLKFLVPALLILAALLLLGALLR